MPSKNPTITDKIVSSTGRTLVDASGVAFLSPALLSQGKAIFVKPYSGNNSLDGLSPDTAVKTLAKALSLATANQNDTIYLFAESNTASATTDYQAATLTWNKDLVHLVGVGSPTNFSQRARIAQLSTATGVSPLVNVTANGCIFSNFSIFQGVDNATSLVALQVTGSRNVFNNVHIGGIGHATQVAAGAASLKIAGGSENRFIGCTIGLDTISRDQNCTELWFTSSASRNVFEDCLINSYISNAGFASITVGSNGIDRINQFKDCLIFTKSTNKAVAQTSVCSIPAISQGAIVLQNTYAGTDGGAADWDSNNRGIIWNNSVAAAASAGGGVLTNQ